MQVTGSSNATSTFGTGTRIDVETTGSLGGIFQASVSGDLTTVFGANSQMNVTNTGLTFLGSTAISQLTTSGIASTILGSGVHIISSGNTFAEGVFQRSLGNSFVLGENSSITSEAEGEGRGLRQTNSAPSTTNSAFIHANSRISVTAGTDAFGIQQETDTGTNTIQFGPNGQISTSADTEAFGIEQTNDTGDSHAVFGSGTKLNVFSATFDAFALSQRHTTSGDLTSVFGTGARITVGGNEAKFINQRTPDGSASANIGAGAQINVTGVGVAIAVDQVSDANTFILGENSVINVEAGSISFGLSQDSLNPTATNKIIIGANSRINVSGAGDSFGIASEADGALSSSIIVNKGAEINASGIEAPALIPSEIISIFKTTAG